MAKVKSPKVERNQKVLRTDDGTYIGYLVNDQISGVCIGAFYLAGPKGVAIIVKSPNGVATLTREELIPLNITDPNYYHYKTIYLGGVEWAFPKPGAGDVVQSRPLGTAGSDFSVFGVSILFPINEQPPPPA